MPTFWDSTPGFCPFSQAQVRRDNSRRNNLNLKELRPGRGRRMSACRRRVSGAPTSQTGMGWTAGKPCTVPDTFFLFLSILGFIRNFCLKLPLIISFFVILRLRMRSGSVRIRQWQSGRVVSPSTRTRSRPRSWSRITRMPRVSVSNFYKKRIIKGDYARARS